MEMGVISLTRTLSDDVTQEGRTPLLSGFIDEIFKGRVFHHSSYFLHLWLGYTLILRSPKLKSCSPKVSPIPSIPSEVPLCHNSLSLFSLF